MTMDANQKSMDFFETISRANCIALFSNLTYLNKQDIYSVIANYNLDVLLGGSWQRGNPQSGFAITGGGGVRYGIIANQTSETGTSNAWTHDSSVGIGLVSYGGGAYASHGNTAALSTNRSGRFWFYIR